VRLQTKLKPRRCNFAGPRVAGAAMEVAGEIRQVPTYNDMPVRDRQHIRFNLDLYLECLASSTYK